MTATLDAHTYWTAMAHEVSLAQTAATQQQQQQQQQQEKAGAAARWDDFKYGLCELCSKGLEDKSEFVVKVDAYGRYLACYDCDKGSQRGVECWFHPWSWSSKEK